MQILLVPASDDLAVAWLPLDTSQGKGEHGILLGLQSAVGGYLEQVGRSVLDMPSRLANQVVVLMRDETRGATFNRRASKLVGHAHSISGDVVVVRDDGARWGSLPLARAREVAEIALGPGEELKILDPTP